MYSALLPSINTAGLYAGAIKGVGNSNWIPWLIGLVPWAIFSTNCAISVDKCAHCFAS